MAGDLLQYGVPDPTTYHPVEIVGAAFPGSTGRAGARVDKLHERHKVYRYRYETIRMARLRRTSGRSPPGGTAPADDTAIFLAKGAKIGATRQARITESLGSRDPSPRRPASPFARLRGFDSSRSSRGTLPTRDPPGPTERGPTVTPPSAQVPLPFPRCVLRRSATGWRRRPGGRPRRHRACRRWPPPCERGRGYARPGRRGR